MFYDEVRSEAAEHLVFVVFATKLAFRGRASKTSDNYQTRRTFLEARSTASLQ